jgi:hypothetical protein
MRGACTPRKMERADPVIWTLRTNYIQRGSRSSAFTHRLYYSLTMANSMASNYFDHLTPGLKEAAEVCPGFQTSQRRVCAVANILSEFEFPDQDTQSLSRMSSNNDEALEVCAVSHFPPPSAESTNRSCSKATSPTVAKPPSRLPMALHLVDLPMIAGRPHVSCIHYSKSTMVSRCRITTPPTRASSKNDL